MTARLEVYEQVLTCSSCARCTEGSGPVPFTGPSPTKVAVLGEHPGKDDDNAGALFLGDAGDKLRGILIGLLGLDPADVFFCNAVSCWGSDTPTKGELAACDANKLAQLRLAAPEWLLVLGATALHSFHPGLPIGKVRGRFFQPAVLPGTTAFVTYHPAAAVRKGEFEMTMIEDLSKFKTTMREGRWPWETQLADASCVVCDSEFICWYADGIPTCEKHAPAAYHHAHFAAGMANRKLAEAEAAK